MGFNANQTTLRRSFLKRKSNGPKKNANASQENQRYRSVEESPEAPTPLSPLSPLLHSTLKKNLENRELTVIRASKLSAYSSKEDKGKGSNSKSPRLGGGRINSKDIKYKVKFGNAQLLQQ